MNDRHTLYHVTSTDRAMAIVESGLVDPSRATGKRAVCWLVTKSLVPWAIAHVMNRHNLPLSETVVLQCTIHPRRRIKTNRAGVWCSEHGVPVADCWYAGDWLDKAELKIYIPSGLRRRGWRYGTQNL